MNGSPKCGAAQLLGLSWRDGTGRGAARAACLALALAGCAASPQPRPGACAALDTVLGPLVRAAQDSGLAVEIAARSDLRPDPGLTQRWADIESFGFAPVWRDPATDNALREVYRRTYSAMSREIRSENPDGADRQAWEAAYAEIGHDRLYGEEALWSAFFRANRRDARWTCAARFAEARGAELVTPDAPLAENAARFIPARPGIAGERAVISAWSVYPPLDDGAAREGGTIWLLSPSGETWRVISARRLDG